MLQVTKLHPDSLFVFTEIPTIFFLRVGDKLLMQGPGKAEWLEDVHNLEHLGSICQLFIKGSPIVLDLDLSEVSIFVTPEGTTTNLVECVTQRAEALGCPTQKTNFLRSYYSK